MAFEIKFSMVRSEIKLASHIPLSFLVLTHCKSNYKAENRTPQYNDDLLSPDVQLYLI
jgi:hypothetical protein